MQFEADSSTTGERLGNTWAGATPLLRSCRAARAVLVAPAHMMFWMRSVSVTNTQPIRFWIADGYAA
jgi:hypothetical protein